MVGNTIIIILCVTILFQLVSQKSEHNRRYRELKDRLDKIDSALDRR